MPQSLADILEAARQMVSALGANQAQVTARGGTPAFIAAGQSKLQRAQALEDEQEALKAALKAKTAELEAVQAELKAWHSEAVGLVKLAYRGQTEKWVEFGIHSRR